MATNLAKAYVQIVPSAEGIWYEGYGVRHYRVHRLGI